MVPKSDKQPRPCKVLALSTDFIQLPYFTVGWRTNMEDAHLIAPNIATDISVFGVFDGHGGKSAFSHLESLMPYFNRQGGSKVCAKALCRGVAKK